MKQETVPTAYDLVEDAPRMQQMCTEGDPELFRSILGRIGDKWSMMLIGVLQQGPQRFNELKRMIPDISARMLTISLRQLERDGLVSRTAYPEIPPRVEYATTALGDTLQRPILGLAAWVAEHQEEIRGQREDYDERNDA